MVTTAFHAATVATILQYTYQHHTCHGFSLVGPQMQRQGPRHEEAHDANVSRRSFANKIKDLIGISTTTAAIAIASPLPSHAKSPPPNPLEDILTIRDASDVLQTLLANWEKATIDCTYADVPRELLESKNKEQLLEKASTFALFDKSTSVVSCKKTNKIVRDYIGVTGKGPLVNIHKKMLKRSVVQAYVDPDDLDEYYAQVESFEGAISRAAAASYAAGVADFDSMNNFEKGSEKETNSGEGDSNLNQARAAIDDARVSIERIVALLDKNIEQ